MLLYYYLFVWVGSLVGSAQGLLLTAQGLLLARLGGPHGIWGFEPSLATCKASSLPIELPLWPLSLFNCVA